MIKIISLPYNKSAVLKSNQQSCFNNKPTAFCKTTQDNIALENLNAVLVFQAGILAYCFGVYAHAKSIFLAADIPCTAT